MSGPRAFRVVSTIEPSLKSLIGASSAGEAKSLVAHSIMDAGYGGRNVWKTLRCRRLPEHDEVVDRQLAKGLPVPFYVTDDDLRRVEQDAAAVRATLFGACTAHFVRTGQHSEAAVSARDAITQAKVAVGEEAPCPD